MAAAPNGIFPRNGVPPREAGPGALTTAQSTCDELFYRTDCNQRIDTQSLNTIISEIVAAVNCSGLTYDCTKLDNLCRAINKIAADNELQTILTRNGNFINADHDGSALNVVIREPKLVRNGDAVTLTFYSPTGVEEEVTIVAPKDLIVLNNPTFYVRSATGRPNPPIENEDDLTEANAFDKFSSMFQFIRRTLLMGNVTVNAGGDFIQSSDSLTWSPEQFKGINSVSLVPEDNDYRKLTIHGGGAGATGTRGLAATNGMNITIPRGLILDLENPKNAIVDGEGYGLYASRSSAITVRGTIHVKGSYDTTIPLAGIYRIFYVEDGTISLGGYRSNGGELTVLLDMDAGSKFDYLTMSTNSGMITMSSATFTVVRDLELVMGMFRTSSLGRMHFSADVDGSAYTFTFNGAGQLKTPFVVEAISLSQISGARYPSLPQNVINNTATVIEGGEKTHKIDKFSFFASAGYGFDLGSNPRFTVV